MLQEICLLSEKDQKQLVVEGRVPFVTTNIGGEFTEKFEDLSEIHSRHYPQIFDKGRIRSIEEQKSRLNSSVRSGRKTTKARKRKVVIDLEDVVSAFSESSGKSTEDIMNFLACDRQ